MLPAALQDRLEFVVDGFVGDGLLGRLLFCVGYLWLGGDVAAGWGVIPETYLFCYALTTGGEVGLGLVGDPGLGVGVFVGGGFVLLDEALELGDVVLVVDLGDVGGGVVRLFVVLGFG